MAAAILWQNKNKTAAVFAPFVLLFPLLLDVYLQKKYGAYNNGIFSFFCFYHEAAHSYTRAGKEALKNLQITNTEVLVTYIRFLFSPQGFLIFFDYLNDISFSIFKIIFNKYFYLILSISVVLFISNKKNRLFNSKAILLTVIHFIVLPGIYLAAPEKLPPLFLFYSFILAWLTYLFRQYMTCMFLVMCLGGTLLFAMMGMPGGLRVSSNFIFCLPVAWICLFLEPEGEGFSFEKLPLNSLIIMNIGCLLFLYLISSFYCPPSITELKPGTAIKFAADKTMNLSMYYRENGDIFYAAEDGKSIGFIRPYSSIICPNDKSSGSFKTPCKLE